MNLIFKLFEDRKWTTYSFILLLPLCYISPLLTTNVYLLAAGLSGTIFIPFLLIVLWLTNNTWYQRITKPVWVKSAVSLALIFYSVKSNVYAANFINETFSVNSSLFPITTIFLTLVYFTVTYLKWIIAIPYITSLVFGGIVLALVILFTKTLKLCAIRFVKIFVFLFFLSATNSSINNLENYLPVIVKQVAIDNDFSSNHRCVNLLKPSVESVIFMPSGKVFAYRYTTNGPDFSVEECEFTLKTSG